MEEMEADERAGEGQKLEKRKRNKRGTEDKAQVTKGSRGLVNGRDE